MIAGLVQRSPLVMLVAFCTLLFGIISYVGLPREAAPDVEVPFIIVTTPYPGVSPADVESLVTTPIENEISGLKDLKKMASTSAEGVSIITLEFEPEANIDESIQRVRDRVNRAKTKLPEDIEETDVNEVSFSEMPIMIATIAGPVSEEDLKAMGEDLQEKIERIPGVLKAELTGGREREIRVQVDPHRLAHFSLSLDDVIAAVANENVNVPGGDVAVGDASYLLRVPGEMATAEELEGVAIKRKGDRPVFIRDIARVVDGFADRATYARMNGEVSISLSVSKRVGSNIPMVAGEVKKLLDRESKTFPKGVTYRVLGDQSKMIADMVSDLENGILLALLLVVSVIMFFMGVRNSLFVAIAIPFSFLLGMAVIDLLGMTLNMVVLFSLILVLGMLVDNAIVIVENIYRHAEMGKPMKQAAVDGTREVAIAVAASTATTVAAFFPMVFWSGIMGGFMGYLPKTVIIVLVASLIVALGVLPVLTARFMSVKKSSPGHTGSSFQDSKIMGWYKRLLHLSIERRYLSAGLGIATLIGTFMAYGAWNHGVEFFPDSEPNRAVISVRAPEGTDIEATDTIVRKVEQLLAGEENVDVYVAEVGVSGNQDPAQATAATGNVARITVDFLPDAISARKGDKTRVESTHVTVERIRTAIADIPGGEVTIDKEMMGPPVGAPVSVEVSGDDFDKVGEYAQLIKRELAKIPGTTKLTDDYRVGRPEMRLRVDRAAAKRVGASTREVAQTIRTAVAGTKASALRDGEDEYDIVVELAPTFKDDLQSVLGMRVPGRVDTSPDTFAIPLSTVASYELAGGSGSIRHLDQKLVVTITGQVADGFNQAVIQGQVMEWIKNTEHPQQMAVRLGGSNDEQQATAEFLGRALLIGLALIVIVLVSQFNGFSSPAIIMFSVILSLIGVLWGLVITGTPFGILMTGIGVISLAGVVVNNAIVLLDYVGQLRKQGMNTHDALIEAGMARFRPVVLTALTTMLGLVPMALGISVNFTEFTLGKGSQSTQWWGAMAVAVIFGLAVATVLTLVMVPTLYSIFDDIKKRLFDFRDPPTPQ